MRIFLTIEILQEELKRDLTVIHSIHIIDDHRNTASLHIYIYSDATWDLKKYILSL